MQFWRSRIGLVAAASALVVALGAAAFGLGWGFPPAPEAGQPDPARLALGQRVYAEHCAACHGARLEGQPDWRVRKPDGRLPAPPHDASGHTWHHPEQQLVEITRKGLSGVVPGYQSDMPGFEGTLTEAEIGAVVAYIVSTWPPEIQRLRAERLGS